MINKKRILRLPKVLGSLGLGVMEYWSVEKKDTNSFDITPTLRYFNTPNLVIALGGMCLEFQQHASRRPHHPRTHRQISEVFGDQFIVVGYHPSPVHYKVRRFHRVFDGSRKTPEFLAVR